MSVNSICKSILKITDAEIEELNEIVRGQLEYVHPLKHATAAKQRKLGEHNRQVLRDFITLRNTLKGWKP